MRTTLIPLALIASLCAAQQPSQKLTLADALRLAEQHSPILKAAKADSDAVRDGSRVAKARTLPQLSASGFGTTGNTQSIIRSSPMVEPEATMAVPSGNILVGNLVLMVPLVAPSLQSMVSAANWNAKAAEGDYSEARAELDLQVTEAYDRVLLAREMILAEEANVAAATELVKTSQSLFDAGKGIEATVQRSQAELSQANRALTSARNNETKAILDLESVIGLDMTNPVDPTDSLAGSFPTEILEAYLADGKRNRGTMAAARANVEAASAGIKSAEGQRLPQLYGVAMGAATNREGMNGLTAGLTLSLPLFDGGRISAEVAQAKSMKAKAQAQLRQVELIVEREIRQAWLDVETAKANAESAEASVKGAQSAYEVTVLRLTAGKSILVEQLDALQALIRAKADLAQAHFDQSLAVAKLSRAAGGAK